MVCMWESMWDGSHYPIKSDTTMTLVREVSEIEKAQDPKRLKIKTSLRKNKTEFTRLCPTFTYLVSLL